jgi:peptide/nickel transport system substrate-binding protein
MTRMAVLGFRRLLPLTVAALLGASLTWGLATSFAASSSPTAGPAKVVLKIGWTNEPDDLNPFIGWSEPSYEIWYINYDFLFRDYGVDMKPALDLATEFPTVQNGGISADGKLWTIHIKSGVKWQDGQPLTADDVAFTYNYMVKNSMAMFTIATDGIKEAKAVDPTTVQIVCSRPKANMESIFLPILPKHIWQHVTPQAAATSFGSKLPIVGSGPFQCVEWKRGAYLRLVRNPYWSGKKPTVDEILFEMYQNPDTMATDLKSGNIDAAWGILEAEFNGLKAAKGIQTVAYNFLNWGYLNMNGYTGTTTGNPVLRDARFRAALNWAIDRQKICDLAYAGNAQPGTTIMPPNEWTNPDYHWQPPADQLYTFDLAKANQLLDQARYPRGAGGWRLYKGKPISLRLWSTSDYAPGAEVGKLIAGWFTQLGLKINYSQIGYGALIARLWNYKGNTYAPDFDMYIYDWDGYVDPGETLACETTAQIGSTNEPSWSNSRFDALDQQQATALDPSKRRDIIQQMQQVMYEQAPWLVLTYPDHLEAYNTDKWTGWVRVMNGVGPAFYNGSTYSYLNLKPRQTAGGGHSGHGATVIVIVIVAAVAIAAVALVLLRRRPRAMEA